MDSDWSDEVDSFSRTAALAVKQVCVNALVSVSIVTVENDRGCVLVDLVMLPVNRGLCNIYQIKQK